MINHVSILVLLEIGLGGKTTLPALVAKIVSILVLLEIGLGDYFNFKHSSMNLVSILVLLEIGLGDFLLLKKFQFLVCFNPCFVGNRSGSDRVKIQLIRKLEFQSLFCWKSVWETKWANTKPHPSWVSILVLLEIGLGGY